MNSPSHSGHPPSVNTSTQALSLQEESSLLNLYEQGILRVANPMRFLALASVPLICHGHWTSLTSQAILCNGATHTLWGMEVEYVQNTVPTWTGNPFEVERAPK